MESKCYVAVRVTTAVRVGLSDVDINSSSHSGLISWEEYLESQMYHGVE
jgi:hypothetical protein